MPNRSNSGLPSVYVSLPPSFPFPQTRSPGRLEVFDITYLHFHDLMEVGLCMGGSGICCTDEEGEQPFSQGDVQIIYPFQNHLSKSLGPEPSRWFWAYLDPAAILSAGSFTDIGEAERWIRREMGVSGIIDRKKYPELCRIAGELVREVFQPEKIRPHREEYFASLFLLLLLELCRVSEPLTKLHFSRDKGLMALAPALDSVKESLDRGELPVVSRLPALCSMSPAGFRRAFKAAVGQSARDYSISCAIRRACALLATTEQKIIDISESVGFSSVSGFGRCFLRQTGLTPTAYRALATRLDAKTDGAQKTPGEPE